MKHDAPMHLEELEQAAGTGVVDAPVTFDHVVAATRRHGRKWGAFVVSVALVAVAVALLWPARYAATASLMSVGGGMSQGTLGRLAKLANITPERNELPAETLTTILESRRIADRVLDHDFTDVPGGSVSKPFKNWITGTRPSDEPKRTKIYRRLRDISQFRIDPETRIVHLRLETRSAHLSAAALNLFVDELNRYATTEHQNKSRAVRRFIGERIDEVRVDLQAAEDRLHAFYSANQNYAKTMDPDIQIERLRLERELELKAQLLVELAAQHESALVEERNEASLIQIIDRAAPPDMRSWPRRTFIVVTATAAALAIAAFGLLLQARRLALGPVPRAAATDAVRVAA